MSKSFTCQMCGGMKISAETDEELVEKVQEHAKEVHDQEMEREQILSMVQAD